MIKGTSLERKAYGLAGFSVSPEMCRSVTLSTMHGCPPDEIEAICAYMLTEQKLDTYVKLNPTLLGFDTVKEILSDLGYGYVELNRDGFGHDLQYPRALSILNNLRDLADKEGRRFGVKLTNTLANHNSRGVLPGEEMYLSGRALFPLSINLAARLSEEFDGTLPISYSGGVTVHNAEKLFAAGIRPITLATDMLKPGGYLRQGQIAELLDKADDAVWHRTSIDVKALSTLAAGSRKDRTLHKDFRGTDEVRNPGELPLFNCYVAPCVTACAINQHIPEYIRLVGEERYGEALECIYERNALPSITGSICDHQCQLVCTRLDYEGCLNIREVKKIAVEKGSDEYRRRWVKPEVKHKERVAVIGAGPADFRLPTFWPGKVSLLLFLSGKPMPRSCPLCGALVPYKRQAIDRDIDFIRDHGVEFRFGVDEAISIPALEAEGFSYTVLGLGTYRTRKLPVEGIITGCIRHFHFFPSLTGTRQSWRWDGGSPLSVREIPPWTAPGRHCVAGGWKR